MKQWFTVRCSIELYIESTSTADEVEDECIYALRGPGVINALSDALPGFEEYSKVAASVCGVWTGESFFKKKKV